MKPLSELKIAICSDHAGFELKQKIIGYLKAKNVDEIEDFGAFSTESCDYPDYAHKIGEAIEGGELEMGIILCGTGNGMAITVNKYPHIRAGLAWNEDVAKLISAHNKANILVIPARFVTQEELFKIIDAYLDTPFEAGRHLERINKISEK